MAHSGFSCGTWPVALVRSPGRRPLCRGVWLRPGRRYGHPRAKQYPVEQEFEGAVWLPAKRDLRGEHEQAALADGRFDHFDAAIEVSLAERPTATQRRRRIEPGDRL